MCILLIAKFLILAALMGSNAFTQTRCFQFNFSDFPETSNAQLSFKNSTLSKNSLQVTFDVRTSIANQSGRAFYKDPFRLWRRNKKVKATFNSSFVFRIVNQTVESGEGLAFILSGNKDLPRNSDGRWLGIVNASTNGSSQAQVVAVEFDTRKNFPEDIDSNHVGLDVNSVYSIKQAPITSVKLSNDTDIRVRVEYDGENIIVFMGEDIVNPVLFEPIDLSRYLPEKVYVGFSGSTSDHTQLNCVTSWAFHGADIGEDSKPFRILIIILVLLVVLLSAVAFYFYWKWRSKTRELEDYSIEAQINGSALAPKKFSLRELKKATDNFNSKNKLGQGGFGTVYKGTWKNIEMAVKRVSQTSHQGKQEFIAEVTTIGHLRHRNLVKLIGWCYEKGNFLLVYEYMPNSSLDKFIFYDKKKDAAAEESKGLTWEKRLSIIHGTAQALDYLHNGSEKRVLHRDIKASNIMLDAEFRARLGDFGLARTIHESQQTHHTTHAIAGTPGYMAPETFLTPRATVETDVYAFGVLMLEVACGRKPVSFSEDINYSNSIVHWVWELHREGRILDAADPRLEGEFSEKEMERVLVLGLACCHPNRQLRPSMTMVLQVLSGEVDLPDVPSERPHFIWPPMPPSCSDSDNTGSCQIDPITEVTGR